MISMKRSIIKAILVLLIVLQGSELYSQKFGLGLEAIYNFQTNSFAPGIRGEFVKGQISIVPQIAYYPGFNKVSEFYAGASLHCNIMSYGTYTLYAILHGSYNGWINYESSPMDNAKFSNWCLEGGLGLKTSKCIRPFLEFRYNVKWKEANLRLGVMYFFNCKDKKNGKSRKKKPVSCPAYDQ
jgi:hypothetical protein